jgi:hypothetical protein
VNARYLKLSNQALAQRLVRDLIRVGTLRDEQGVLVAL